LFKNKLTELLGIEYPIIQGALGGGLSGPELVAAVSNAGGLGIIASLTYETPQGLREEIKKTKSMTDRPFAVNVALLPTIRPVNYEEYISAAIEEGVSAIETAAGRLEPYAKMIKDSGVKWMHKVGSARHAKTAERFGVDVVDVVSFEAAGHPLPDDVAASALIPACVDAVSVPVVMAGGVADGRGFVSALALGAEGVMMGTRFVATKECAAHATLKEWFVQLSERDTMIIQRSIGNMTRAVRTEYTEKVLAMEEKGAKLEEILAMISGELVSNAYQSGDYSTAVVTAGQVVGLIHDIPTAKELIDSIINEAKVIVRRLNSTAAA